MEQGSCSLEAYLSTQNITGKDWDQIKIELIMKQITRAVWHLHYNGIIHSDLKHQFSLNLVSSYSIGFLTDKVGTHLGMYSRSMV